MAAAAPPPSRLTPGHGAQAAVRALLLTDVVDSTQTAQALGDERMAALWQAHDRLARDLLPRHGGREIDKTDGMLLLFERAADALDYAAAYHAGLAAVAAAMSQPLAARAGLHVGPVMLRANSADDVARGAKPLEVEGLAKPTAARVMSLARGGQTLVSQDAAQALAAEGRADALVSLGHWRLKGVSEPVELHEPAEAALGAPPDAEKAYRVLRAGTRWLPAREVPNNLPQPGTAFVGRERELDEIKALLGRARLVTLLGMGGLGKTRLSLQVAAELRAEFPDGTWFLDLSPLREGARVADEAARLLQVQEEPGRSLLQAIAAALQDKRLLLVVDNCEHLIDAASALAATLLRQCPDVRLVTSSRIALHVAGEQTYPVQPLAVPRLAAGQAIDRAALAALAALPSVQLFVQRAQAQRAGFQLDAAQAPAVAELVARLEGIPLALELAAARVRSMAVADINARLKDRYRLLTGGSRVLQERQQTLRALVDWSYELLAPAEQTLLARLAVFVGGFDLAAAEAVCGSEPLDPLDIVDLLDRLVGHSLVMVADQGDGSMRYSMLETLREYAADKLRELPDAEPVAARHAEHLFVVAKQARDGLKGADHGLWAARLEDEFDNLRAAMATARAGIADPLLAAKIPVALQNFFITRGYLTEGRELMRAALTLPAVRASDLARAHTLYAAATLAVAQGDPREAGEQLATCLALRRTAGDTRGAAQTLSTLAMARLAAGEPAAALTAGQEALALFRELGDGVGEAIVQLQLGQVLIGLERWGEAVSHLRESLAQGRRLANREVETESEWLLGRCAQSAGDFAAARQHLAQAQAIAQDAGDRRGEARAGAALGRLALQQGELADARLQMAAALAAFQAYDMRAELLASLEDHAALAHALQQPSQAAVLLAVAGRARAASGLAREPMAAVQVGVLEESLREALGDWAWTQAMTAADATSLVDALQAALVLGQLEQAAVAA
jgi:predicted ATPase/class 3 adenylate cyclase